MAVLPAHMPTEAWISFRSGAENVLTVLLRTQTIDRLKSTPFGITRLIRSEGDKRNVQPSPKGPPFALPPHYLSLWSFSLGLFTAYAWYAEDRSGMATNEANETLTLCARSWLMALSSILGTWRL
jgi:hypothetical protein